MSDLPIIGITGRKRHGKNTVALIASDEIGGQVVAYADALRRETFEAIGHRYAATVEEWTQYLEDHKEDPGHWGRPFLQWWGTDFRRRFFGDDYWIKQLSLTPGMCVADVRFVNEAQAVRDAGGVVWKVINPRVGRGSDTHVSETEIDLIQPDMVIFNAGTVDQLAETVRNHLGALQRVLAA